MLEGSRIAHPDKNGGPQFTCFAGTKVQILTLKALQAATPAVYSLCWYKSTNTDAQGAAGSNTRFQAVAAAYETLSDADRKEAYDAASDIRRDLQQVCGLKLLVCEALSDAGRKEAYDVLLSW